MSTYRLTPQGIQALLSYKRDIELALANDNLEGFNIRDEGLYVVLHHATIGTNCVWGERLTHQQILTAALADVDEALKGNLYKPANCRHVFAGNGDNYLALDREYYSTPAQRALTQTVKRLNNVYSFIR